jgi:hypothetical protein
MRREVETGLSGDVPIVPSQWYGTAKWILEKYCRRPTSNSQRKIRNSHPTHLVRVRKYRLFQLLRHFFSPHT